MFRWSYINMEKSHLLLKYFISRKLFFCKPMNGPWKKGKHKPMKNFSGETSFVLSNLLSVCCSFLTVTYSWRPTWNLRQFTFSRTHFSTAFLQFLHLFFLFSPHLFSKHSSANLRFFAQTLLSNLNVRHVSLQPSRFPHLPLPREKKDFPPGEGWCPGYV